MLDVTAPAGKVSLAFVFDTTGSMSNDLEIVKNGAQRVLNSATKRPNQPLHNFLLVPFNDPHVGPITRTTNAQNFKNQINKLRLESGGGDCPELSMSAIREALLLSLDNSFIYVFTDADAKDIHYKDEILDIIQRKKSQVTFIMTGDCGNRSDENYQVYESIAAVSSGFVYHFNKNNMDVMINHLQDSIRNDKVVLLTTHYSEGGQKTWNIPFDSTLG